MAKLDRLPVIEEREIQSLTLTATSAGACLRGRYSWSGRRVAVKLLPNLLSHREGWGKQEQVKPQPHHRHVYSERLLVPLGLYRTRLLSSVVWEWMAEGSLHSLLSEKKLHSKVPTCLGLRILLDVAEGLSYLHSMPLPHLALTATHVLFDQHYRAKLSDWGVSELYPSERPCPCYRNLPYVASEALEGDKCSLKTDMYSFGVLSWETLNRRQASEDFAQLQMLCGREQCLEQGSEEHAVLPADTPNGHALTGLILRCWNTDPHRRPSAEDCILELTKALSTFDPEAPTKAALNLKKFKEGASLSCKDSPAWEIPIELNNLEMNFSDNKCMRSKTLPMDIPRTTSPQTPTHVGYCTRSNSSPLQPSPPRTGHPVSSSPGGVDQTSPGSGHSGHHSYHSRSTLQCSPGRAWAVSAQRHSQPSPPSKSPSPPPPPKTLTPPSKSPPTAPLKSPSPSGSNSNLTQLTHSQSRSRNQDQSDCSPAPRRLSCLLLLQERRELIVRGMTEGRLNHLLDVLRSRGVLSCEAYEIITATATLAARTRSLLDTCHCLGEKVAALVAVTLGLVSVRSSSTTTTTSSTRGNTTLAH
ncbi:receptor-interacting serine/threonine-protein kinase 2 [Engraulis encrasicolus]|uniref:receptor-interacting serine/threonine-protein kinase 2 n=1 Tax=Engraulis encrasicolus TaxID=184585 RepID=UPI002FD36192